ncbi:MAG: hypothetical protein AB1403_18165, partial [Candidatus Riflebacteria bacterium]
MRTDKLSGKIKFSLLQIVSIWVLTAIFPAVMVLFSFDYLSVKQIEHAKTQALSHASGHINRFDNLLKTEDFLQSRVQKLIKTLNQLNPTDS